MANGEVLRVIVRLGDIDETVPIEVSGAFISSQGPEEIMSVYAIFEGFVLDGWLVVLRCIQSGFRLGDLRDSVRGRWLTTKAR